MMARALLRVVIISNTRASNARTSTADRRAHPVSSGGAAAGPVTATRATDAATATGTQPLGYPRS